MRLRWRYSCKLGIIGYHKLELNIQDIVTYQVQMKEGRLQFQELLVGVGKWHPHTGIT
jgi:hypothetical protein